jgi:hypothetical protein
MIVTSVKGIRVGEVWFDENPEQLDADVLRYYARSNPMDGIPCLESHTVLIDLRKSQNSLWGGFNRNTREEINMAERRYGFAYHSSDVGDPDVVDRFCDFYDRFAEHKGLAKVRRQSIKTLANEGALDLSEVRTQDGTTLVWHSFLKGKCRVRGLHAPSLLREKAETNYRSMVGCANRYQHWRTMLRHKAGGVSFYDLGGWYAGNEDQAKLGVNKFKRSFGGQVCKNYDFELAVTPKGKAALWVRRVFLRRRPGIDLITILATGWSQTTTR